MDFRYAGEPKVSNCTISKYSNETKYKMLKLLYITILTLTIPNISYAYTCESLYDDCDSFSRSIYSTKTSPGMCVGYFIAYSNLMKKHQVVTIGNNIEPDYCIEASASHLIRVFLRWMDRHPKQLEEEYAIFCVERAFKEVFKCNDENIPTFKR